MAESTIVTFVILTGVAALVFLCVATWALMIYGIYAVWKEFKKALGGK